MGSVFKGINEQIIKENFPAFFIKVAEKEQYLREFLEGKLYMRPSGYFRKVDNDFRGDPYDGRKPFDTELYHIVFENPDTGERLFLDKEHGVDITYSALGFDGDDLIPVFCLFKLDYSVMQIIDETTFRIEPQYVQELSKFGDYFTIVDSRELISRILEYNSKSEFQFIWGNVDYKAISDQYPLNSFAKMQKDPYHSLFVKRDNYKYQNEWRLVLTSSTPRFKSVDDHIYVNIRELPPKSILPIKALNTIVFRFVEKE